MNIRQVIKEKGFTLKQVADMMPNNRENKTGITKGAFSQMVSGHVSIDTLRTIASLIGCKVGDFFKDEMTETENIPQQPSIVCPKCGKVIPLDIKISSHGQED